MLSDKETLVNTRIVLENKCDKYKLIQILLFF